MSDKIIIDASVACKWFFLEEGSERARQLVTQPMAAPELMLTEVANIVWKILRAQRLKPDDAKEVMAKLTSLPLDVHDSRPLLPLAFQIAATCDRTIYDAIYIALAEVEDAVVISADTRLFNALSSTPWGARVKLL